MNRELFEFIKKAPTAFHTVAETAFRLETEGYELLSESGNLSLERGKKYYVTRNSSSLIAFRIPAGTASGFMMTAAHGDSPAFKIKENAEIAGENYVQLSVEKYGGMLAASWMDRPLSVAGRLITRDGNGITTVLVDLEKPVALIPNLAIHMNRKANEGVALNPAVDMLPLAGLSGRKGSFRAAVAEAAGISESDILADDLFVYNPEPGTEWGDFISAPRLDDLQCVFSALSAFLKAETKSAIPVFCLFDNEEVGSTTKQGAASTFLRDTLSGAVHSLGGTEEDYRRFVANSFLLSCDNAHAVHPNHPEYADKNHAPKLNGGVVLKYNAAQKYTSDAVSAAVFRMICERAGVPVQIYTNRADLPGGSTLGNIANTQVSLNTADIGLAQLAMHSAYETAGSLDTEYMVRALTAYYESAVHMETDGCYTVE